MVGLLFGICFSAIGLGCYQLKRISACEQMIREMRSQIKPKPAK
jgi:hypothetical protein